MEMRDIIHILKKATKIALLLVLLLLCSDTQLYSQPPQTVYTVRDGRMFIVLDKNIRDPSLDSFVNQYEIHNLYLKEFIRRGIKDSLLKLGWRIEFDNKDGIMISKPLFGLDNIDNPANKIKFTQKDQDLAARFPARNNGVKFGHNQFRNKFPFATNDSIVTFFLKGYNQARRVMLAGSFNNWNPDALEMTKTDSGWIANVKLGPGKYWYKFIPNGNWIVDNDNALRENDGQGNINSVFYKTNMIFRLEGYTNAKRVYVAGSFNDWNPDGLPMTRTATGWEIPLYLAEGTHTYRFVADKRWFHDPANEARFPNEFGQYNSVVRLGKSYLFRLDGHTEAKQIFLTGSFNRWRDNELEMTKVNGGWELQYTLGPGNYEYAFVIDGKRSGLPFSTVIQPNYTFRLKGFPNAKTVYLAGDFNNWSSGVLAMKREGDDWVYSVHLSAGKHEYKFIVDGKWIIDPHNKLWEQNEHDSGNSIIWISE